MADILSIKDMRDEPVEPCGDVGGVAPSVLSYTTMNAIDSLSIKTNNNLSLPERTEI
jgi:hypothetical protein